MTQYINDVSESNISRVYTTNNTSKIKVFYKAEKKLKTLSGLEIAEFLNQTIDSKNNGRNRTITKNVEEGIICHVKGIYKDKNGEYKYIKPMVPLVSILSKLTLLKLVVNKLILLKPIVNQMMLVQQKYMSLFQNEQAILFRLNHIVPNSISNIPKLKERYEKILGFEPAEGLCHSLNYFFVLTDMNKKEDFVGLFESGNIIGEQDIIHYVNKKEEQTYQLPVILALSQCLPALNVENIEERENHKLFNDTLFYKEKCFPHLTITKQIISLEEQKELERILHEVKSGCYIELCYCCSDYKSVGKANYDAHSMLIYTKNGKCFFFDSNHGVTGFHPETGLPNLTPKEVCDIVVSAVDFYSSEQIGRSQNASSLGEQKISITLKNASLTMERVEEFYNTTENPTSKIVDISVDKKTGELLFTPVLP